MRTYFPAPGKVINLRQSSPFEKDVVTIGWSCPTNNPQCVASWHVEVWGVPLEDECDLQARGKVMN